MQVSSEFWKKGVGGGAGGGDGGGAGGGDGGGAGGARAARDVFAAGTCDAGFLELARLLGWLPDLAAVRDRLPDASAALLDEALEKEAAANRRR